MTEQELAEVFNGYDDTLRRVNKTKSQAYQKRTESSIRIKKLNNLKKNQQNPHFLNAHGFPKSIALTALLFAGA